MDFSKLNQDQLQEFLQYYLLLTPVEQAEILFQKLMEKGQSKYPDSVVNLYISSVISTGNSYTRDQILNLDQEKIGEFFNAFKIAPSGILTNDRNRTIEILNLAGLISDVNDLDVGTVGDIHDLDVGTVNDTHNPDVGTIGGIHDLDVNAISVIVETLKLPDLMNLCNSNKLLNEKICQDEDLWLNKFKKDFPNNNVIPDERYGLGTWKRLYLYTYQNKNGYTNFSYSVGDKYEDIYFIKVKGEVLTYIVRRASCDQWNVDEDEEIICSDQEVDKLFEQPLFLSTKEDGYIYLDFDGDVVKLEPEEVSTLGQLAKIFVDYYDKPIEESSYDDKVFQNNIETEYELGLHDQEFYNKYLNRTLTNGDIKLTDEYIYYEGLNEVSNGVYVILYRS